MTDRGFNIRDLLLCKNACLNILAFSYGKQLSGRALGKAKKIASLRLHVECLENFKMVQGVIPLQVKNSLSQVLWICAILPNMQDPLAKE